MKMVIAGRPNVGKSTIFNRFIGRKRSIVHDQPGVTRDVVSELIEMDDFDIELLDTGGLDYQETKGSDITKQSYEHAYRFLKQADLLLFVVDGREGLHPLDEANYKELRKLNLPTILLINKIDPGTTLRSAHDFHKLGIKTQAEVSAEHGLGFGNLEEHILEILKRLKENNTGQAEAQAEPSPNQLRLAIVGRPNVGKSSFVNAILGQDRMIVSEVQGTTRDSVDVEVQRGEQSFVLVDTAGLRKKSKVQEAVEFFSSVRTRASVDSANVVLMMIDAQENITTQEAKIASEIVSKGKGLLIFANKMDLCPQGEAFRKGFREEFYYRAPFLRFCEVAFGSAEKKFGLESALKASQAIFKRFRPNISSEDLKQAYQSILASNPPKGPKGFHLEFKKLSYQERKVPTFLVRCNRPQWVPDELKRYFSNSIYEMFDFRGVPIQLIFHQNAVNSDPDEDEAGRV